MLFCPRGAVSQTKTKEHASCNQHANASHQRTGRCQTPFVDPLTTAHKAKGRRHACPGERSAFKHRITSQRADTAESARTSLPLVSMQNHNAKRISYVETLCSLVDSNLAGIHTGCHCLFNPFLHCCSHSAVASQCPCQSASMLACPFPEKCCCKAWHFFSDCQTPN